VSGIVIAGSGERDHVLAFCVGTHLCPFSIKTRHDGRAGEKPEELG
jgi:hypothetical protein